MSVELIVEVLLHAPPTLTPAEKLLLTVIAESCNGATRMTWYRAGWDAEEVARRAHLTPGSLSKTFWSLAQKGCEVRVAHGTDKHGKPVFAHKGKQTTFKLPKFAPQRVDSGPDLPAQRSDEDRTFTADETAKGPTYVGVRSDEDRGLEAQRSDVRRTLLLKELPSKTPSSLSPREDDGPEPSDVTPEPEREIADASLNQTDNPIHRLLLDAGCPSERLTEAERWISEECQPRGLGWWRKTGGNGDLKVHVAAFLDAGPAATVCPDCDGTGETGDWMNRRMCECLWFTDPARARKLWVPQLADFLPCDHGVNGGDQRAPNGWQYCSQCRGPGWVDKDMQPRTEERSRSFRRSTSTLRAEQGLAVADELDRENGHGRYAQREIRSPADRVVADAAVLHAKYKRQETGLDEYGNGRKPGSTYYHLHDTRAPGRNYKELLRGEEAS